MSVTIEQFCEIINQNFGEPFLVKDGVSAEVYTDEDGEKSLCIQIGRRDVQIGENGEVIGAGTIMGVPDNRLDVDFD